MNLNPFKKKEEEKNYPHEFGLIVINDVARMKGIKDNQNKLILHYKAGTVFKTYPYSPEMVASLKKIYQMPIVEVEDNEEEEFEFDTVTEFGTTRMVKRR